MSVTLLITTHNRGDLLAKSLDALRHFTLPDELIVVDDGGTDDTQAVLANAGLGCPTRYIYNNNPGWTSNCLARNIGIRAAHGDHVLISEPEVVFLTDVIPQLLAVKAELPNAVPYGATLRPERENQTPDECQLEVQIPYFTLYGREWLIEAGGYDEGFEDPYAWDDVDLNTRLGHMGHLTVFAFHARAFHQYHPSRNMAADRNEARHRAKEWPRDLVANQDHEWGVVRA